MVRNPLSEDAWRNIDSGALDLIKVVVDTRRGVLALGGELHADAERLLLDDGSTQEDLWGANIYPHAPLEDELQYEAMVNIRPRVGNRSTVIQDQAVRDAVRNVICTLLPLRSCSTKR